MSAVVQDPITVNQLNSNGLIEDREVLNDIVKESEESVNNTVTEEVEGVASFDNNHINNAINEDCKLVEAEANVNDNLNGHLEGNADLKNESITEVTENAHQSFNSAEITPPHPDVITNDVDPVKEEPAVEFTKGINCTDAPTALQILRTKYKLADVRSRTARTSSFSDSSFNLGDVVRGPHRESFYWRDSKRRKVRRSRTTELKASVAPQSYSAPDGGKPETKPDDNDDGEASDEEMEEICNKIEARDKEIAAMLKKILDQDEPRPNELEQLTVGTEPSATLDRRIVEDKETPPRKGNAFSRLMRALRKRFARKREDGDKKDDNEKSDTTKSPKRGILRRAQSDPKPPKPGLKKKITSSLEDLKRGRKGTETPQSEPASATNSLKRNRKTKEAKKEKMEVSTQVTQAKLEMTGQPSVTQGSVDGKAKNTSGELAANKPLKGANVSVAVAVTEKMEGEALLQKAITHETNTSINCSTEKSVACDSSQFNSIHDKKEIDNQKVDEYVPRGNHNDPNIIPCDLGNEAYNGNVHMDLQDIAQAQHALNAASVDVSQNNDVFDTYNNCIADVLVPNENQAILINQQADTFADAGHISSDLNDVTQCGGIPEWATDKNIVVDTANHENNLENTDETFHCGGVPEESSNRYEQGLVAEATTDIDHIAFNVNDVNLCGGIPQESIDTIVSEEAENVNKGSEVAVNPNEMKDSDITQDKYETGGAFVIENKSASDPDVSAEFVEKDEQALISSATAKTKELEIDPDRAMLYDDPEFQNGHTNEEDADMLTSQTKSEIPSNTDEVSLEEKTENKAIT